MLVGSLVSDNLLLRDFEPYGIIFMNARVVIAVNMVKMLGIRVLCESIYECVVITVAIVMLLRDFVSYGILITVCVCYF
jgi:hypothetical protein